ncbi:hypothetical protein [Streptosporangium sp. NPDC002721]|uniref:hypothetical protein n=1 Tax=Streptosporangium sp. NPDC002721 TaxID=3366188 RepID=UPI00368A1E22
MQPPQKSIRRNSPNGSSGLSQPKPDPTDTKPGTPVDGSPVRPPSHGDVPQIPESPPGSPRDSAEENSEELSDQLLLLSLVNRTRRGGDSAPRPQFEVGGATLVKVLGEVIKQFEKFPAGDVMKPLNDEKAALESRKDELGEVGYRIAQERLKQELEPVAKLMLSATNAIKWYPLHRRRVLDMLQEAATSGDLTDKIGPAYLFATDDMLQFFDDLEAVEKIEKEGTADLSPARMQEVIIRIVANLPKLTGQTAESFGRALCKLYLSLDLDPRFAEHDLEVRTRTLARLKGELKDECRKWSTLSSDERLAALEKARDIQCAERGISDWKPEIVLVDDLNQYTPNGWPVTLAHFAPEFSLMKINTDGPGWQDFDEVIDSLVHENTHHYQYWLINQLFALPPMGTDDPRYFQATLFALNQKHGYIEGGESYVDRKLAFDIYSLQPMERHAFLAGGEARGIFLPDAKQEAAELLTRLRKMLEERPGHSGLELQITMMYETIANSKLSSNAIYRNVDDVLAFLSQLD